MTTEPREFWVLLNDESDPIGIYCNDGDPNEIARRDSCAKLLREDGFDIKIIHVREVRGE